MKVIGHFQGSWGGEPLINELLPAIEDSGMDVAKIKKATLVLHEEGGREEQGGILEWVMLSETTEELELAGKMILTICEKIMGVDEEPLGFYLNKLIPNCKKMFGDELKTYGQKSHRYYWEIEYSSDYVEWEMVMKKIPVFEEKLFVMLATTNHQMMKAIEEMETGGLKND